MVGRKITFPNHRFWVYIRKTCFGSRITRMTKHVENHIHIAIGSTWNTRRNRYQRGTQTGWQWPPFWLVEMFKVESYTWVRCFFTFSVFLFGCVVFNQSRYVFPQLSGEASVWLTWEHHGQMLLGKNTNVHQFLTYTPRNSCLGIIAICPELLPYVLPKNHVFAEISFECRLFFNPGTGKRFTTEILPWKHRVYHALFRLL